MTEKKVESFYSLALSLAQGIGSVFFKNIIDHFGTSQKVFELSKKELLEIPKGGALLANAMENKKELLEKAEKILTNNAKRDINIISYGEERYPTRLKQIYDPPPILYCTKEVDLNRAHVISIVGTRKATRYGIEVTKRIVSGLKEHNVLIVSGLAYGIDIIAHKEAIDCGLSTVAIIPGGVDKVYPPEHAQIISKSIGNGSLISQYTLGTESSVYNFPERNRIIAGISDATIVVEAPKKSGALITARYANEYNREVFAIPGNIESPNSSGCNTLIKSHQAHLMTSLDDLTYIMNWESVSAKEFFVSRSRYLSSLTSKERTFIQKIRSTQQPTFSKEKLAEIGEKSSDYMSTLLQLELKGVLELYQGGEYRLKVA